MVLLSAGAFRIIDLAQPVIPQVVESLSHLCHFLKVPLLPPSDAFHVIFYAFQLLFQFPGTF